jgi:hypothetical protein
MMRTFFGMSGHSPGEHTVQPPPGTLNHVGAVNGNAADPLFGSLPTVTASAEAIPLRTIHHLFRREDFL